MYLATTWKLQIETASTGMAILEYQPNAIASAAQAEIANKEK